MDTISGVAVNDGGVLLRTCGLGFVLRSSPALAVLCSERLLAEIWPSGAFPPPRGLGGDPTGLMPSGKCSAVPVSLHQCGAGRRIGLRLWTQAQHFSFFLVKVKFLFHALTYGCDTYVVM